MTTQNPYAPPSAMVSDESEAVGGESLIPGGRNCPAGNGWIWITQGWGLFKAQPLMWWAALLICMMCVMVVAIIPLVNMLNMLVTPVLVAGFGVCARSVLHKGNFEMGLLFEGFRKRFGSLLLLGLLYMVMVVAAVIVMGVITYFGFASTFATLAHPETAPDPMAMIPAMLLLLVLALVFLTPVFACIIFSPYLVMEFDMPPTQAMMESLRGCFKNMGSGTVFVIVLVIASIVAMIPFGLGMLVLAPVSYLAVYMAYRDIFVDTTTEPAGIDA